MDGQVPDLVSDPITDTMRALEAKSVHEIFYKAAEDAGFTNPQDVATHRYRQWTESGYHALPPYIKDFCLRTLNRLDTKEYIRKVVIH